MSVVRAISNRITHPELRGRTFPMRNVIGSLLPPLKRTARPGTTVEMVNALPYMIAATRNRPKIIYYVL
jgi:hypothetical protein